MSGSHTRLPQRSFHHPQRGLHHPQRSLHHPQRSPRHRLLHHLLHHRLHHLRVIRSSPPPPRKSNLALLLPQRTRASSATLAKPSTGKPRSKRIRLRVRKKGKRRADIDTVAKFEEREAKKEWS